MGSCHNHEPSDHLRERCILKVIQNDLRYIVVHEKCTETPVGYSGGIQPSVGPRLSFVALPLRLRPPGFPSRFLLAALDHRDGRRFAIDRHRTGFFSLAWPLGTPKTHHRGLSRTLGPDHLPGLAYRFSMVTKDV